LTGIDELLVGNGRAGCGAPKQKAGEVADAAAAIEAVIPLAGVARQVLLADAVEGAVEPGLQVAERDMDDGQHGVGVLAAVLDDRIMAKAVGEPVVALEGTLLGIGLPEREERYAGWVTGPGGSPPRRDPRGRIVKTIGDGLLSAQQGDDVVVGLTRRQLGLCGPLSAS
jgi:hypothetical protein